MIERGEHVVAMRGNRPVAEIRSARRRTGKDLRAALGDMPPPDEQFDKDVADEVALLTHDGNDAWADA